MYHMWKVIFIPGQYHFYFSLSISILLLLIPWSYAHMFYGIILFNLNLDIIILRLIAIGLFAESISCLEESVNIFLDMGRFNMSAKYYKVKNK